MNEYGIRYCISPKSAGVVGQYVGNVGNNIQPIMRYLQSQYYNVYSQYYNDPIDTLYIILDGEIICKVKIK